MGFVAKPPLSIYLDQPTRVVAWVGINWHASAHKRCPVFRRRAPELSIVAEADDLYDLAKVVQVIRLGNLKTLKSRPRTLCSVAPNSASPTELPGANRSLVAKRRGA